MTIAIIIVITFVVLYYVGKNKRKDPRPDQVGNRTFEPDSTFQSKLSDLKFPDRIDAIQWHNQKIQQGLKTGDFELANLSYAKLYESIRQQNINENGNYGDILAAIGKEYEEFRRHFSLKYPEQFLPPEERKKKIDQDFESIKDVGVFLETGNYSELPKPILKYVDIVKPISAWYETEFKPKPDGNNRWKTIKRNDRYFGFYNAKPNNAIHQTSLETGKRITKKPYYIKALNEQGIPLTDFVLYGEDLECFVRAVDFFDNQEFDKAKVEIDKALLLRQDVDYKDLKIDIEIKLNNEQVVDEEFKKYRFDIDTAVHTGKINEWLKVLIHNGKYEKVIQFIEKTNEILDQLASGQIEPKIYGKQSSDWYEHKKQEFNKNLIYIFDVKHSELSMSEQTIQMLELFLTLYKKEDFRPIEKIADQFRSWGLTARANELYLTCLKMIENEDKPRVKSRIENKIIR